MRTKKAFLFDEEQEAANIYMNGFTNSIDYNKMYLVAKYIRQTYGYGEIRLEKELIRFCKKQDKNFNPVIEALFIKKWIKSAISYNLRKIDNIIISKKEIEILKPITNNKERKLMFFTLVFSKALKKGNTRKNKDKLQTTDNYYIHYNNFLDIIRLSGLTNIGEIELANIYHKYKNYFTFYKAERELLRLEFVDKNPKAEITICDLNKLNAYYNIFFMEKKSSGICRKCNNIIIKNNNKQIYCKECAKEIRKEKQKNLMRQRRAVSK